MGHDGSGMQRRLKTGAPGKRWWLKPWHYPGIPIPPRHQSTYEVKA